jgi:hypothetical protein
MDAKGHRSAAALVQDDRGVTNRYESGHEHKPTKRVCGPVGYGNRGEQARRNDAVLSLRREPIGKARGFAERRGLIYQEDNLAFRERLALHFHYRTCESEARPTPRDFPCIVPSSASLLFIERREILPRFRLRRLDMDDEGLLFVLECGEHRLHRRCREFRTSLIDEAKLGKLGSNITQRTSMPLR